MFCTYCKKIVAIRQRKGQDYYGDLCVSCQRNTQAAVYRTILAQIPKESCCLRCPSLT